MGADPMLDLKVWSYAIKRQVDDLTTSITECDKIIAILMKLQVDVAQVQDALEAELDKIKNNLESSVKAQRAKMADLEQQLKSAGCVNNSAELLRAIFTLGIACAFDSPTKIKLQNVRNSLIEEETILKALLKRMGYFDGLVDVAKTLTEQATGLLETTRHFRAALAEQRDVLVQEYSDEDIIENMGDVDFANDFAQLLKHDLEGLQAECKKVGEDCI